MDRPGLRRISAEIVAELEVSLRHVVNATIISRCEDKRSRRDDGIRVSAGLFVVMGVSGSGKSVIGAALARSLGVEFLDGDDFHSPANVARMSSGIPLTDQDRAQWVAVLAGKLRQASAAGLGLVVACSALKRGYRDILRAGVPELKFILLEGSRPLIAERLAHRAGHFMPPSLLDSQLATLESPTPDEDAWVFDIRKTPDEIVAGILARAAA
jgi:gluconokinase